MKIIGLTGSIGTGKSFVAQCFRELGVAVFDADAEIHNLLENDAEVISLVEGQFPESVSDGRVNRAILGEIVFHNPEKLKMLENILHPLVRKRGEEFIKKAEADNAKLVIQDIPLLFETGADKTCDYTIVVKAPEDVQRQRVMQRENMDDDKYEAINRLQLSPAEKEKRADFIIDTNLPRDKVKGQVRGVVDGLLL